MNEEKRYYEQPGPALASAGPDWKYFCGPHSVTCADIFEEDIK